ncbi:hypothetical protein MO973_37310 [Paenibacillus sp. TRM 82003]|uniref:hypothetical protein n=1 Tax=Kineococcus sp. TRM81007 TaxID=2925831 RepID=UPI001F56BF5A|nr:hypothetical protein [Kineococcus sp. TRM81007]MCI2239830.1 hypothetical protein [Kineococcus sp. TRM81007]MCI3925867.1 hypothetical protein [Paenibacillus sp. TRM 82003]
MDLDAPHDPTDAPDLFDGWTLPDGTREEFAAPLDREELVARFVELCAAAGSRVG